MQFSEILLTFENNQKLSFVKCELSTWFDSIKFLNQFSLELLEFCGFEGKAIFRKLFQRTNCKLEISIEDQYYFEPIALAKYNVNSNN